MLPLSSEEDKAFDFHLLWGNGGAILGGYRNFDMQDLLEKVP